MSKPTLSGFRQARDTLTCSGATVKYALDLDQWDFGPTDKQVHCYDYGGMFGIIIERHFEGGGKHYAWCFSHPCDQVELSLREAEKELFDFYFNEGE